MEFEFPEILPDIDKRDYEYSKPLFYACDNRNIDRLINSISFCEKEIIK